MDEELASLFDEEAIVEDDSDQISDDEDEIADDNKNFIDDNEEISDDNEDSADQQETPDNQAVVEPDTEVDVAPKAKRTKKKDREVSKRLKEFIDDEAELSDEGEFSEDELESSDDDDKIDTDLVDLEAKELNSDEEEDVRRLYHKQIESEDRRALLLLQEQLEENQITGQRRRKFRWQNRELMERSLRRHYDPDDDGSQEADDDDDDDIDYSDFEPRLKRPTADALLLGSSRLAPASKEAFSDDDDDSSLAPTRSYSRSNRYSDDPMPGPSTAMSDDSNSNLINSRPAHRPAPTAIGKTVDLSKFLFRDKELVEALSTKETVIATREEKELSIQRELKRVLQSKSIFDQLYS